MWFFILPVQLTHEHLGAVVLVLVDHVILPDVVFVSDGDVGSHVTNPVKVLEFIKVIKVIYFYLFCIIYVMCYVHIMIRDM